jgi:hypothetical protein
MMYHHINKTVKLLLSLINYAPRRGYVWGNGGIAPPFLISALSGERSGSRHGRFNHRIGGRWEDPAEGMDPG